MFAASIQSHLKWSLMQIRDMSVKCTKICHELAKSVKCGCQHLQHHHMGRHLINRKACWPNEKWRLTKRFFYQKPYILYGIIAMPELFYRSSQWTECQFFFRSILKFHFGLTKKIFNLQLTEGIIDRKFPTFYVPIYPNKMYIFHFIFFLDLQNVQ